MVAALVALLGGAAFGEEADQALVTYTVTAGERQISGVSRSLQWGAIRSGDDAAQVELRVPVASFDSGHPQFDAAMRAALHSDRHPLVEVEGAVRGKQFEGTLTLAGVTRPLAIPMTVVRLDGRLIVQASFALDLREFGLALPAIQPRVIVDLVARLSANPQAVLAGGLLNSN